MTIGVQIEGRASDSVNLIGDTSFVVLRVYWSEIESIQGQYNWPVELDRDIALLSYWPMMINIKNSPLWARMFPDYECSPPRREFIPRLVNFCLAVTQRYHPSLGVSIWNEPEVPADKSPAPHHLGGFGISLASYYGEIVRAIYKRLHRRGVPVIAGELLMESSMFWKKAKTTAKYDAVAFHAYVTDPNRNFDEIGHRAYALRLTGEQKDLYCTETSYKCIGEVPPNFEELQAIYLRYIHDNMGAFGVKRIAWFTLRGGGWQHSDLVKRGVCGAAYNEYRRLTERV